VKHLTEPLASADSKRPAPIKNTDTARVFFALWPEPAIQRQLHAVAKEYQARCDARVMRTDTLHMTLQFIGNIKRSQLPKLISAADKVSATPRFRLELNTLSFWKHNRIGYATLAASEPELEKLASTLQHELANVGFIADSTKFSAHVTLLRNVEHILASQNFMPVTWQVNSFVLVESVTATQKTQYKILREWPFAAPAA
jgi:2'-5' RNA ligase